MDVRTGLIVSLCLMGFTCAEPVKYVDCGKFRLKLHLKLHLKFRLKLHLKLRLKFRPKLHLKFRLKLHLKFRLKLHLNAWVLFPLVFVCE